MRRTLPSLSQLEAFEATARHQSFTRAAEELHLTQGAVSRQVQALEEQLGLPLFHRVQKRIHLSPAGEAYLGEVRVLLDRLEAATLELRTFKGPRGGTLNLAILPTFGTRWLIPHFPGFQAKHPEVQVNFSTRIYAFDFASEGLDAAIHYGEAHWPGAVLDHLMDEEVIAVTSPALAVSIRRPEDLAGHTLLQIRSRPQAWEEWSEGMGLPTALGRRGPVFEHHAMVAQAAGASLGVAAIPRFLIEEELRTGRLVDLFGRGVTSRKAYWLVYPEAKRDLPALRAFREWLLAEMG